MKIRNLLFCLFILLFTSVFSQNNKREFRGAWIQTAFQERFIRMDALQAQKHLIEILDNLKTSGFNAVIFQVRPSADAFYQSDMEPWSRFLTGKRGLRPNQEWDPMAFMIVECHKRNMEFHAWINPYRVTTSKNETLPQDHLYYTNPERFVKYASKIYFDPGLPQNRNHIRRVIRDIVGRYDVDAIHFDDYFYPYPEKGEAFNDFDSFESYRLKAGFSKDQIADWRRSNVNTLIKSVQSDIKSIKPWVRFGISPFGIYRNDPEGKTGSKTNGTEGYSQLYADALLWTKEGWIDYIIPQLYWEIGHKAADYNTLCKWWNDNANNQHLYIGQSISRSVDDGVKSFKVSDRHLEDKITLASKLPFVNGNCFWYGYQINDNENNIRDILQNKYYKYNALIPEYKNLDDRQPKEVKKLKTKWTEKGYMLTWKRDNTKDPMQYQAYFCIYRFPNGVKKDISDPKYLYATTRDTEFKLPYNRGKVAYQYVITSVDRMHNESKKGVSKKIKL